MPPILCSRAQRRTVCSVPQTNSALCGSIQYGGFIYTQVDFETAESWLLVVRGGKRESGAGYKDDFWTLDSNCESSAGTRQSTSCTICAGILGYAEPFGSRRSTAKYISTSCKKNHAAWNKLENSLTVTFRRIFGFCQMLAAAAALPLLLYYRKDEHRRIIHTLCTPPNDCSRVSTWIDTPRPAPTSGTIPTYPPC